MEAFLRGLQLGVLATYAGDSLQAMYYYLSSLAVTFPFSTARANIKLLFEKVGWWPLVSIILI